MSMYILATPLGYVMEWIYKFIPSYGWTIILFTVLVRVLMFPLSIKQQKSTARMSAYQPIMQEIQKKWANDKNRMNEEMMKFQQESGFSMTAGCLPMLVNMLVLFGVIYVIYRPLQFLVHVSADVITQITTLATPALEAANVAIKSPYLQNALIGVIQQNPADYTALLGDKLTEVVNFNTMFLGLDLSTMPQWGFSAVALISMIMPVLSIVTMFVSQIITMKASGTSQQMQGSMKVMMWLMPIMFGYFCFTVPIGFSLYYTVSNVLMLAQSLILKKIYDPEKMKEQIEQELAEKRAAKKKKKQVTVKAETGETVTKDVTESELARIRLAKAREMDEERYRD
jgi:YidC/Oxa1 family membrane protein insertase